MLTVSVQGGTGAGRRRVKNLLKEPWKCACGALNAFYWKSCPSCREPRPERS